ncbi:DUF1707 domain-containing protein [Sphaerisporangium sp. TRM90804]|uniref:DUF1707 SHOCT-like domain-containing protein n=1 Tax=Sphaerisporangium sp. TRM90804 TaxID=3031113 RepID=UPI002449AAD5|nr:DUF1707 domain-containing protein [Sphaerisporangium sp. TRM90804]MDH2428146.1 DUF1707 domain-containing protein [Sphaerisporangium sp. TRM90804]
MSGELMPRSPQTRMSDADREMVAGRLRAAHGEGRLTLEEFEQRLSGALAARTFGEVEPFLADLPGNPVTVAVPEHAVLRTTAATLKRQGTWVVARRLMVVGKGGGVKLDFTDALISDRVVEIDLDVFLGSTRLVLPPGASVDIDDVEFVAGSPHVRRVPTSPIPGPGLHFKVRGKQRGGSLVVRYRRRFGKWKW